MSPDETLKLGSFPDDTKLTKFTKHDDDRPLSDSLLLNICQSHCVLHPTQSPAHFPGATTTGV
jgi:hypothetical protein